MVESRLLTGHLLRRRTRQQEAIPDWALLNDMQSIAAWLETRLSAASSEILLENYIFAAGLWPRQILRILCDKALTGVAVYITLDALGSRSFPESWISELRQSGAHLHFYHRLQLKGLEKRLRRTHRRIVAIDGQWLAVGGFALDDEWLDAKPGSPPYRDMLFACRGALVDRGREIFFRHRPEHLPALPAGVSEEMAFSPESWGEGRFLEGTPPASYAVRRRLLAAIRGARQSIWIATPYFNPDPVILRSIYRAVQRGVDVRLLLAGRITDHPLLRFGIQAYYQKLMRRGVHIYEYQDAFLHAKYVLVDRSWATLGSANFDFLSLWFNHELNLELRLARVSLLLHGLFVREFAISRKIDPEPWRKRPYWRRLPECCLAQLDRWVQAHAMGQRRY
ncbi:cardiolipin synthase B [Acidithiobacillus thiooxidans]|uniref:Cardiolipin synthase B n=1 Tax=Acidithiobacillus thiooxidans TaxID=930 RepID=A0A1C2JIW3_ACITH|nr:phospholipase D-like domain-containing protein [Acidithiobacillus thiooxidans]OCX74027.1 cardiolipin synthase B [Acidithiobacillus thiooxidans]OCX75282.1 cardiolipin synthase B [Acidithiobacillus thiooxidans]OCX77149.1 cardiolipin synthase B [Acidithiobacillus thiooxidans]OCX82557.1 cardiolipin synthase B [Acidithiobacillus thiooxidans]OCX88048.1 cardiolipin synthase B [Acidithiobacillus thiooxidans]